MTYTTAVCTVKNNDDGQRNCPKHVEFYSINKFEKLVHLVGCTGKSIKISHISRGHCEGYDRGREVGLVSWGWVTSTVFRTHSDLDC